MTLGMGWEVCPSPLARMELCWQLGQQSPLKVKQPDVTLGVRCGSLNLTQGPLTPEQVTQWIKSCHITLASC